MVSFSDLGIEPVLVNALKTQGILEPFEVQRESIPDAMLGKDVCCRAPTGSGKTLAFGLPLLSRTTEAEPRRPTSLILTPTRELAEQIYKVLDPLAYDLKLYVEAMYGGVSYKKQFRALDRGVDVLVAWSEGPSRLMMFQWLCLMKQTEWRTWVSWNLSVRFLTHVKRTDRQSCSAPPSMTKLLTLFVITKSILSPSKSDQRKSAWKA